MKTIVYADNASTTKLCREAYEAMLPYMEEKYENPSSLYSKGVFVRTEIEKARMSLLDMLGASGYEGNVVFTSGGAEADSLALIGYAMANRERGNHIITTRIEHHSVLNACSFLKRQGFSISYVSPSREGVVSASDIASLINKDTVLVSVMAVNNEIGTVQPLEEIGNLCRAKGIAFHTDAVQAFGKLNLSVKKINCDMLSVSSHKFHGPKGCGFLYVKKGIKLEPIIFGGTQENGQRGGTENVPAIIGMVKAAQISLSNIDANICKMSLLKNYLLEQLNEKLTGFSINGNSDDSYPGITSITIDNVEGQSLLISLDMKGVLASTGSACAIGLDEPSHVLKAIGLSDEEAKGTLRLSFDESNTTEDIDYVVSAIVESVDYLRKIRGL